MIAYWVISTDIETPRSHFSALSVGQLTLHSVSWRFHAPPPPHPVFHLDNYVQLYKLQLTTKCSKCTFKMHKCTYRPIRYISKILKMQKMHRMDNDRHRDQPSCMLHASSVHAIYVQQTSLNNLCSHIRIVHTQSRKQHQIQQARKAENKKPF